MAPRRKVFLSLPCRPNAPGLTSVINRKLDKEVVQLKKRADTLQDIQKNLKACDLRLLGCRDSNTIV